MMMVHNDAMTRGRMSGAGLGKFVTDQIRAGTAGFNTLCHTFSAQTTTFEVAGLMTLILLMLFSGGEWFIEGPITVLAVVAFLHRPLVRSHNYWFLVAAFLVAGNYYNWFQIDNHKYLMTYWTIAICCVLATEHPERNLARNAQLLIGLVFLFATIWKLISIDYADGSFFTYELLTDGRFQNIAMIFGGITTEIIWHNQQAFQSLMAQGSTITHLQLMGYELVRPLSFFLTWWTVFIEGGLAIAFLLPNTQRTFLVRSSLLLLFLVTTYTNAPVIGFGWLLAVMGIAQCEPQSKIIRFCFIMAFLLIWVYYMPWSDMSYGLFQVRLPLAR